MSITLLHSDELTYGQIRYFAADRCFNTEELQKYNKHKILALIKRPGKEPDWTLQNNGEFTFCGYDLVETLSAISAITDCDASFESINYAALTAYGLISTYKEAVLTQLALVEEAPFEAHADCEILEIWRKLV